MIMKKTINRKLRAFIPQHISNKIVLSVLKILSKLCCVPQSVISSNAAHNSKMLLNRNLYNADCYIENQSQWSAVKFGTKYSMSYSGCEIIAVHNALRALGKGLSVQCMVNLISCFEQDGAVLGGFFGTAPGAIEKYFRENGYAVTRTDSMDTELINNIGERSDTIIVTAYNDKNDIMKQVHTVSITKEEGKTYAVHNAYYHVHGRYEAKKGYQNLQEAVNALSNLQPASLCVIGISGR